MCAAAGLKTDIDFALIAAIQEKSKNMLGTVEHYNLSCLLLVFVAIALPKLAASRQTFFRASVVGKKY